MKLKFIAVLLKYCIFMIGIELISVHAILMTYNISILFKNIFKDKLFHVNATIHVQFAKKCI